MDLGFWINKEKNPANAGGLLVTKDFFVKPQDKGPISGVRISDAWPQVYEQI